MRLLKPFAPLCLLVIGGCAADRAAVTPAQVPAQFAHQAISTGATWPSADWYRGFNSPVLDELVSAATQANLDLESARARVLQADARVRQAGAALLPAIDATANGTYFAGHSSQGGGHEFDWTAMLSASYELDFWGKNRATLQSARYLADASRAQRDTVALTTLAGVANGYFQSLALRARLQIGQSNRDAAKQLLDVVQARFDAGAASPVELATQNTAFDAAQIAIAELRQSEVEAQSALSLLLGKLPREVSAAERGTGGHSRTRRITRHSLGIARAQAGHFLGRSESALCAC